MLAPLPYLDEATRMNEPVIGMLWGSFPCREPPRKFGKLLSWGSVARTFTRSLSIAGRVVPYQPPQESASKDEQQQALASFLTSIDILWADFYPATGPALRLRSELDLACPAMLVAGGTFPKGAEALLFPWQHLLRSDDALLFSCRADQDMWRMLVEWAALRQYVIPCPVDLEVFHPGSDVDKAVARAKYGLPVDSPVLLYVGRRNIQKNLHSLLCLFAKVRETVPDAHLCLVGEDDDIRLAEFAARNTGYRLWLESLADHLDIADGITILEPLFGDDLAEVYRASDIVVNLSVYHRENFGLSQAEAQSCGVPVVCSDWGGFKDVVIHRQTGFLVDTVISKHGVRVDWQAGAYYVIQLLNDDRLRTEMAERAMVWAQDEFAVSRIGSKLGHVVKDLWHPDAGTSRRTLGVAYKPSAFARQYEEHKRTCGWYTDGRMESTGAARRYPPMFEGAHYALYETLMRPYATQLAADLQLNGIQLWWIPYYPADVQLDPIRHIARDHDPIWPHERHLDPREWEVCRRIDGASSVHGVTQALNSGSLSVDSSESTLILWHLFMEGFILFDASSGGGNGAESPYEATVPDHHWGKGTIHSATARRSAPI